MNTALTMKNFLNKANLIAVRDTAIVDQKESLKITGSDYVVRYGFNFSHMSEYKLFPLYRDAVKFFESLDVNMYQSAFLYKQDYYIPDGELYSFARERV